MRRRNGRRDAAGGFGGGQEENKMSELGPGLAHEMEVKDQVGELETGKDFQAYLGPKDERRGRLEDIAEMG